MPRRFIHILFLLLIAVYCSDLQGQMPIKYAVKDTVPADSADIAHYGKKKFWQASAEVVGFNLGLWAFDRYVQHGDFAYISWNSIKENFRHGLIWDNDKLGTNMFLHPYTGNLYFNSARSSGFNFWQSSLFAIAGSAMWEFFMECEYPSTNDIIATPIGGTAIGEVTYRMSDLLLDDRSRGWHRFGREAGVFIIDPMRSLTRIINGDAWRPRLTTGRQFGTPSIGVEVRLGAKAMQFHHDGQRDNKVGSSLGVNVEYGDRFEVHSKSPYDYFRMHAILNLMGTQPVLSELQITGRLLARELLDTKKKQDLSLGIYQNFDYFDSDTIADKNGQAPFKLGVPACLGIGSLYRNAELPGFTFDAYAHFNGVFLAGILSDYYALDERNYNWAMGFSAKLGAAAVWGMGKLSLLVSSSVYRLYTFKGYESDLRSANPRTLNAMGDNSAATFSLTRLGLQWRIWRRLYMEATANYYYRYTHYRDYPSVSSSTWEQTLGLLYKF